MKTLLKTMPLLVVLCVAVFVFPNQASALEVHVGSSPTSPLDQIRYLNQAHNDPGLAPSGKITYDKADPSNTVTLENAVIVLNDSTKSIGVYGDPKTEQLNIVLVGDNKIIANGREVSEGIDKGHVGISSEVDLIFSGSGSLTITSGVGTGIEGTDVAEIDVIVNGGSLSVTGNFADPNGDGTSGIIGNLFVGAGAQSVYVKGSKSSVSGTITEVGKKLSTNPNPYSYPKIEDQQAPVNRENVVFPMNSSLSNPSSLTFTFEGGYFANFEGVWIHGYAVPTSAYTTRVIDGVLYIYLNEDYLFYVLGLARGEEHLMHAVFSNGYGITKFIF